MALEKPIETSTGVVAEYHKIMGMDIDYPLRRVTVRTASFVTREARMAGKQWLAIAMDELQIPPEMDVAQVNIVWAYQQLKAKLPGAEDC